MRALLSTVSLAALLACSCATTSSTSRAGSKDGPEVLQFDPVLVTPEMELAQLNDEELFALGTSAFAAADYEKASRCFLRLADNFPASKHHDSAAFNAGLALERLGKWAEALERFRPLMDPAKGSGDALDASFRAAECYYHLDEYLPAVEILSTVAAREDVPAQDRLQAKVHRGICLLESGDLDGAERALRESLTFWGEKKESERLDEYFPGQAQFFLGEIYRVFFERVELDPEQGEDKLGKDLESKCEFLLSAQGHFLRTIRIGDGQWATAAGFRIGALYESLYDAMTLAKVPPGLDEEQAKIYREELHKKVRVLVTKAMTIYERTLAAAERIGAENPFVAKTQESLDRLKQILRETPEEPAASPVGTESQDVSKPTS
ncbi:MAG: tetratricopeptide repeat protein [Deltaproteobacteria bacterium]|nr:tetratricopeptide repeat protein [Deltaproteobacteria bacterium]